MNPYGQKVKQKYIGYIDVFEPFEKLKKNIEIFSSTFLIDKSELKRENWLLKT